MLQLFQLAVLEGERFQLFQLVAQQLVACALVIAGIAQPLQGLPGLAPALCGQLHLASEFLAAAVFVQQAAMGIGLE